MLVSYLTLLLLSKSRTSMKRRQGHRYAKIVMVAALIAPTLTAFSAITSKAAGEKTIAEVLRWVPLHDAPSNVCQGYYYSPPEVLAVSHPASAQDSPTTATGAAAMFSQKGTSQLTGDVVVNQPGRQLLADKAFLYRNPKTSKMTRID
jgi:hypothetical protein